MRFQKVALRFCLLALFVALHWLVWQAGYAASPPPSVRTPHLSTPLTLSGGNNDATHPVIARSGGTLYVAWEEAGQTGGTTDPFYSRSVAGGPWITPVALHTASTDALRPTLTAAGANMLVLWDEWNGVTHQSYQQAIGDATPLPIPPAVTLAPSAHSMVVDSHNQIHMVLQGNKSGSVTPYHILYSHKALTATVWPTATTVYTGSTGTGSQYPALAVDSHDNLHLVWQENVGTDDGVLYYSKGLAGDGGSITWTAPVSLSAIAPITDSARPALAIDAGDGLHLVWEDHVAPSQQYIYYAHSLDNSAVLTTPTRWSTPTLVMTRPAKANDTSPSYVSPAIAVAGQTVYVAWHDSTSDFNDQEEILYAFSTNQGASWSDPINVSQSAGVQSLFPQLVAEGGGIVHFVWQEKVNGTFVVRYTRTRWEIFLPLIMKNP